VFLGGGFAQNNFRFICIDVPGVCSFYFCVVWGIWLIHPFSPWWTFELFLVSVAKPLIHIGMHSFLLWIYIGVGLLGHRVGIHWVWLDIAKCVPKQSYCFTFPPIMSKNSGHSTFPSWPGLNPTNSIYTKRCYSFLDLRTSESIFLSNITYSRRRTLLYKGFSLPTKQKEKYTFFTASFCKGLRKFTNRHAVT
jgi:hypothetical protein